MFQNGQMEEGHYIGYDPYGNVCGVSAVDPKFSPLYVLLTQLKLDFYV